MNMKKTIIATLAAGAAAFAFADAATPPSVSGVTMEQASDRLVTIGYTLADGPAVITLDIQTNATENAAADDPGWTSIGGEAIWNAAGDVWKKVTGDGAHTITWRPVDTWPGHKITGNGARAVVTAWALDNTPQFMVVDLMAANTVNFYPGKDFLPKASFSQEGAAITNNPAFKGTKLLMRKIEAAGIPWMMGSDENEIGHAEGTSDRPNAEKLHQVTLADNYYIGVFELTVSQYALVNAGTLVTTLDAKAKSALNFNGLRGNNYGSDPGSGKFLYKLRDKTGIAFDLPSEAQWEYACRAGHGSGLWGDGSAILAATGTDSNLDRLGLYKKSGSSEGANGIAIAEVGSYAPNSWDLYDMHGNLIELCLDTYVEDISSNATGVPIVDGTDYVTRGGGRGYWAFRARSADRSKSFTKNVNSSPVLGCRVVCPVGIE